MLWVSAVKNSRRMLIWSVGNVLCFCCEPKSACAENRCRHIYLTYLLRSKNSACVIKRWVIIAKYLLGNKVVVCWYVRWNWFWVSAANQSRRVSIPAGNRFLVCCPYKESRPASVGLILIMWLLRITLKVCCGEQKKKKNEWKWCRKHAASRKILSPVCTKGLWSGVTYIQ